MRYLTLEEVVLIHDRVLDRAGGSPGIRDWHLLDSAVHCPQASFGGDELYTGLFTKAAALGHSLASNHPFVDGNKRTAWEAMHTMVEENGHSLAAEADEIVEFMLAIANEDREVETMAAWLAAHSEPVED